jgi:ATP-dependent DNA ligase
MSTEDLSDRLTASALSVAELREFGCKCCDRLVDLFGEPVIKELIELGRRRAANLIDERMNPTLVAKLPVGPHWSYEPKFDGYRIVAVRDGGAVRLYSRRGNVFTDRYPAAVRSLAALKPKQFVLDGEIMAFDAQGRPSFQLLQNAGSKFGSGLSLSPVWISWSGQPAGICGIRSLSP